MSDSQGPWDRDPEPGQANATIRLVFWVVSLVAIGAAIWRLSTLFPGQISSDWDQARLIQLVVILALVSGGLIFSRHLKFREVARNLAIWTGIVAVLAIGFAFQSELQEIGSRLRSELFPGSPVASTGDVVTVTASENGHFYLMGNVNGGPVRFLIDTGATDIVLSPSDAKRIGVDLESLNFTRLTGTANGIGHAAPLTLQNLSVGPITLSDVPVDVNEADMDTSLLGMSFLRRLRSFEFQGRRLVLRY